MKLSAKEQERLEMRVIYCGILKPKDLDGQAPKRYHHAPPGSHKKPGSYGEGFGGEALVCLFPDDDGQWFRDLCNAKDPSGKWDVGFSAS